MWRETGKGFFMIIKEVTKEDIPVWLAIAHDGDAIIARMIPDIAVFYAGFNDYMQRKIQHHEAFKAHDTISGKCMGVIAFSKNNNRITFLGINKTANFHTIGTKLVEYALKELDNTKEITASVLDSNVGVFQKERSLFKTFSFIEANDKIMESGVQAIQMKRQPKENTIIG